MSELKAYRPYANRDGFYHKSEADKPVQPIELLKPRIMKNGCEYYLAGEVRICIEQAARQIVESNSVYKELDTIIKHQKYKRCLAMSKWCASRSASWCFDPADDKLHKSDFYEKWKLRWRKLAEKFKPNKSTAQ